eukprot:scaffold4498_cov119-Isochrysis_galbana.AAC.42
MSTDTSVSVVLGWAEMGCHPDTGLGKKTKPLSARTAKTKFGAKVAAAFSFLLCCSIAAVDGSRSQIVAGSSRTNRLAAMPPFLALCLWWGGGWGG